MALLTVGASLRCAAITIPLTFAARFKRKPA